ncbi:MAG: RNA polymerase factor sigma-54 [Flavobacteriales bacterium]|jgi:RNA polymerase sigma-54 factor|nr:RNA polymerase factor sigma-54 [Flavobacteriales bacterium]
MIKQSLYQKQLQKLSPQQIQLMKLIQLPILEFEEAVKNELEVNPALEEGSEKVEETQYGSDEQEREIHEEETEFIQAEDLNIDAYLSDDETPGYKMYSNNQSTDDEEKVIPFAVPYSFHEQLVDQIGMLPLNDHQEQLAKYLVGCISGNGYLRRELEEVVDDLAFNMNVMTTEEELEEVLIYIHQLDPVGVGARNLQECLLIQLKRKSKNFTRDLAISIIENYFDAFSKKHFKKIQSKLNCTDDELRDSMELISKLNPKPGNSHGSSGLKGQQQIIPDFEIRIVDGEIELLMHGRNVPDLRVNKSYVNMIQDYKGNKQNQTKKNKEAALFAKQKLDSAKWFIDAIKQRHQTLNVTINAVIDRQRAYFLTGDEAKLKPMILKDIADVIGMDISTVSRVANSKYIQTPYGTKLIKEFFSESMKNAEGEDVSTRELKNKLKEIVEAENKKKPLTDEKLAKAMKEAGYPIARRTIAKYREQLNIPVARMRKKI